MILEISLEVGPVLETSHFSWSHSSEDRYWHVYHRQSVEENTVLGDVPVLTWRSDFHRRALKISGEGQKIQ